MFRFIYGFIAIETATKKSDGFLVFNK